MVTRCVRVMMMMSQPSATSPSPMVSQEPSPPSSASSPVTTSIMYFMCLAIKSIGFELLIVFVDLLICFLLSSLLISIVVLVVILTIITFFTMSCCCSYSSSSRRRRSSSRASPPRCDAQTSYFLDLLWSEMLCFTALFSVVIEGGNCSWFRVYFLYLFERCSSISHLKMLVFTALVLLSFLIFLLFFEVSIFVPKT